MLEARNGRESLQKLGEAKINLCVLDLMMPEMDGFEFCRRARRPTGISVPRRERPSRDQLIEDVWGYDFEGNERTLDVHVGRLRERFPAGRYRFGITTVRGRLPAGGAEMIEGRE